MELSAHAITDRGSFRSENEDCYIKKIALCEQDTFGTTGIFAVCDGVGGYDHGEIASRQACRMLYDWWKDEYPVVYNEPDDSLIQCIHKINESLNIYGSDNKCKLATTLTVMLVNNGYALVFHIGDAKILKHDGQTGEMKFLTNDHTKTIEETGRTYLTQCLGNILNRKPSIFLDYAEINVGDRFYIGSDGILGELEPGEIVSETGEDACKKLLFKAREKGSKDNITLITLEAKGTE